MSPTSTWCCHTTPPVSTTTRTTLPHKHGPHGTPPSATPAGITSSQPSGSPKFERSEQHSEISERTPFRGSKVSECGFPRGTAQGTLAHASSDDLAFYYAALKSQA